MFLQIKSIKRYEDNSMFRKTKKNQQSGLRRWEATTQPGVDTVRWSPDCIPAPNYAQICQPRRIGGKEMNTSVSMHVV